MHEDVPEVVLAHQTDACHNQEDLQNHQDASLGDVDRMHADFGIARVSWGKLPTLDT